MPYPGGKKANEKKVPAEGVHDYLVACVEEQGLAPQIELNSIVTQVAYSSSARTAMLTVQDAVSGEVRMEGPFDQVLFSSFSGKAHMPDVTDEGFAGTLMHSGEMSEAVIERINAENLKVLVVGAGKSGADMMMIMRDCEQVTWLYRKPYFYSKFEVLFHNHSLLYQIKAWLWMVSLVLFRFSSTLGIWWAYIIGAVVRMPGPSHFDGATYHMGVLDKDQVAFLKKQKPTIGTVTGLSESGVVLKDGTRVDADVVVMATGYEGGITDIAFVKDGEPFAIEDKPLFDYIMLPEFPVLFLSGTLLNFGPKKGVSIAEYMAWRLTTEPLTEERMRKKADNLRAYLSPIRSVLYRSDHSFLHEWMKYYHDFWSLGYMSIPTFLHFARGVFVVGYVPVPSFSFSKKARRNAKKVLKARAKAAKKSGRAVAPKQDLESGITN